MLDFADSSIPKEAEQSPLANELLAFFLREFAGENLGSDHFLVGLGINFFPVFRHEYVVIKCLYEIFF